MAGITGCMRVGWEGPKGQGDGQATTAPGIAIALGDAAAAAAAEAGGQPGRQRSRRLQGKKRDEIKHAGNIGDL